MKLFDLLANQVDHNRILESNEYKFYTTHKTVLDNLPFFSKYYRVDDAFSLVQSIIIIKGLINKLAVESLVIEDKKTCTAKVNKIKKKLDHFDHNGVEVYIPFLLPNHNDLYFKTPNKLLDFPYSQFVDDYSDSIIDCFDVYNYALFDSSFADLIYLDKDETSRAYYHPTLQIIFIINRQGRADVSIHLFDRKMESVENENIVRRASAVVKHYYANDKIGFVDSLFVNRLISEKLYKRIYKSLKLNK